MMMKPTTEPELAAAIAAAKGPLRLVGGGTRPVGNPVDGEVLDLSGLSGIRLYEPGSLTLVAAAGTRLRDIETALNVENQRLAFEPMDHCALLGTSGASTIGGVVAANVSGPRRVQAGACRDFLLGVRFVDGNGSILKNGGRVMKNVTGYDLVKLMAGSFGTLGALSEVALKVLPQPETQAVLELTGLEDQQAVAAMAAALGSPFDVTGAAHVSGGSTFLRLEGFSESVAYRATQLAARLARFGDVSIEDNVGRVVEIWRAIRDVALFHGQSGDVWRISVKPSDGPLVADMLAPFAARIVYDWGGGLIWALVPENSDVRARIASIRGHARLERASDETRRRLGVFGSEGVVVDRLAAGLRARFDPRGILNSGLMG